MHSYANIYILTIATKLLSDELNDSMRNESPSNTAGTEASNSRSVLSTCNTFLSDT